MFHDDWQARREGSPRERSRVWPWLGLLCFVLALTLGAISAYLAGDCESDAPFELPPLAVGALVIGGVFALTESSLLRFLGVIAGIVGGLLVLLIEFAVAMSNCFEI